MNIINLLGRIATEVELKTLDNDRPYTSFILAVDYYKVNTKFTNFIDCMAFGKNAEFITTYLQQGDEFAFTGHLIGEFKEIEGEDGKLKGKLDMHVVVDRSYFTHGRKKKPGQAEDSQPKEDAVPEPDDAAAEMEF